MMQKKNKKKTKNNKNNKNICKVKNNANSANIFFKMLMHHTSVFFFFNMDTHRIVNI